MNPKTILIVDDIAINLKLLRAQLEAEGHFVIGASNGVEAIKVLNRETIDVIISDILMPEMDGYRLCYEVRKNPRFEQTPFIFHSASYTSPADEKLSMELGADQFLRKPAAIEELLDAIAAAATSTHRRPAVGLDGMEVLKEYSERLVSKLEEKNMELIASAFQRQQAEDELRNTHAQLRQLLEHSPAVIYSLTLDRERFIPKLISENITELLGFTVAETMSFEWWFSSLHPSDREQALASVAATISEGMVRIEYRLRHKDGSYRWVEDNRRLVRDAQGEPSELVGVWTNITERRRAQDERRASDRRFSDMLRNLQLVAMMLDRDGGITYCNDYLLQITGWQLDELIGQDWLEMFVPPEAFDDVKAVFSQLLDDAPASWHHENEILTRAGERRLIHWNNSLLRSADGDVIGTASIGEDITDRRNREMQFLRAQRLESLGTLAGGIAHDLNNLFMPILMGVTLIRRFETPEAIRKAVDNIERCVRRGTDLVKQVLLFARGADDVSKVQVEVADIVGEVESIALSTFPRNVRFTTSIGRSLPRITGDATQLAQVLLNLCVNARDAMPAGGRITVSAEDIEVSDQGAALEGGSSGRYVVLDVTDNGSGMPQKVIDRIFEPFFTTKGVGEGTGLGLSTTLGIVRSHQGFITVSSEVGKGSTFRVHFPAHSEVTDATAIVQEVELPRGNGELILVVDDERAVLDMTRQTLEASGYQVLTAEDGALAIPVFVSHRSRIALVLTDMLMPVMDGATLIGTLRRIDRNVPIIAASGIGEPVHAAKAENAGTPYFLAKPFTAALMLQTVFRVLHDSGTPVM